LSRRTPRDAEEEQRIAGASEEETAACAPLAESMALVGRVGEERVAQTKETVKRDSVRLNLLTQHFFHKDPAEYEWWHTNE
jgi:hypothetical protein